MKRVIACIAAVFWMICFDALPVWAGWNQVESGWKYADGDAGWSDRWGQVDGAWYHFDPAGVMDTGWLKDEGRWYFLYADGRMAVGWVYTGENWYYLHEDGSMAAGWLQDHEDWYYLDREEGNMLCDVVTPDGYRVGRNGVWLAGAEKGAGARKGVGAGGRTSGSGNSGSGGGGKGSGGDSGPVVKLPEEEDKRIESAGGSEVGEGKHPEPGAGAEDEGGGHDPEDDAAATGGGVSENKGGAGDEENACYELIFLDEETKARLGYRQGTGAAGSQIRVVCPNIAGYEICGDEELSFMLYQERTVLEIYYKRLAKASPSDAKMVGWTIRFIDVENREYEILKGLSGESVEGGTLTVPFPEKVMGTDGYIWEALEKSPWKVKVYGPGIQKYTVSYRKKEKIGDEEDAEREAVLRLEYWNREALKDEELLLGEEQGGLTGEPWMINGKEECEKRIQEMISGLDDGEWCSFYLIGKNYEPQSRLIGEHLPQGTYSCVKRDEFRLGEDLYLVYQARVKKKYEEGTCSHVWEVERTSMPHCLRYGNKITVCGRCGREQTIFLPPSGHVDVNRDSICDICGKEMEEVDVARLRWKIGDAIAGTIGGEEYLFRCIDEDYTDGGNNHDRSALFLCDRLIRSDADRTEEEWREITFGEDNNYKRSRVRTWLEEKEKDLSFQLCTTFLGGGTAYTGSTEEHGYGQLEDADLKAVDIGFQWLQGRLFILSAEEALRYKDYLWKFNGSAAENAETCYSSHSKGYWLRTPLAQKGNEGDFQYGNQVYIVDLLLGNIHPADVAVKSIGIRPAFVMPQL